MKQSKFMFLAWCGFIAGQLLHSIIYSVEPGNMFYTALICATVWSAVGTLEKVT